MLKKLMHAPHGTIKKHFITILTGTASAQLIMIASMPIITRIYDPVMIGIISIYLSFFNFWSTFLSLRFDTALLVASSEDEALSIYRVGSLFVLLMSFISFPIISVLINNSFIGFNVLPAWAPYFCVVSLIGFGIFTLYRSWLLWYGDTKTISKATIARSIGNVSVRIGAGVMGLGIVGLFLAELVSSWSALFTARKKVFSSRSTHNQKSTLSLHSLTSVFIKFKKYPLYEVPSSFFNQLALMLPVPAIGMIYGAEAAGWYGLAKLLFAIPNRQIGGAISDVFQMELSKCVREGDIKRGQRLFYKFAKKLSIFSFIALIGIIGLAPPLAALVFGNEWSEMGKIAAYIAPWMCSALIVSSLCRALSVLQFQELKFIYDLLSLIIIISVFYFSSVNELLIYETLIILTIGMVFAYFVYFLLIVYAFKSSVNS